MVQYDVYTCRHIGKNGKQQLPLPQEMWEQATGVKLGDTVDGSEPRMNTTVQSVWNDWGVYIRFYCEDDHIHATLTNRDDPLYTEDVVELFISPDQKREHYAEFVFSPKNIQYDAMINNNLQGKVEVDPSWDCPELDSFVSIEEGLTVYEIGIPLEAMQQIGGAIPQPGIETSWLINFYRIDHAKNGETAYSAWSPTGAVNYHRPWKFGTIIFVK